MKNLIMSLKEQGNKRLEKVQIEEVNSLFQKYSIPTYLLTDLYNYTAGIRILIEYFIEKCGKK